MKRLFSFTTLSAFIFLFSCSNSEGGNDLNRNISSADKSFADSTTLQSEAGNRRFIRTASLKFKVNKVEDAVIAVENKTRGLGGFVSLSQMQNSVQDSIVVPINPDSSMQTTHYITKGILILRVPDYRLDSLLTGLNSLSAFMMNREIHSEDVRIQILANQFTYQRSAKINQRLTTDIEGKGRRLSEIEQAEKTLEEKDESADNAKISALNLEDAVEFSTVTVEVYQDPGIRYQGISRERAITEYETPFLTQVGQSFSDGWQMFKDLFITVTKYWSAFVICGIGYILFMKYFLSVKKIKMESRNL